MAGTERKAWEQQQRRNRIIDNAEFVFLRDGYDGATIPAIAAAAGYNKRTLYLYFQDKQELFLAVVPLTGRQRDPAVAVDHPVPGQVVLARAGV